MAEKTFPFVNRGFVSKIQAGELQQGQVQSGNNFESLQEGSINSRAGRKLLGVFPAAVFGLRKFRVGDYDLVNPRYFTAFDDTLWRTTNLFATWQQIAVGFTDPNRHAQRFSIAPYSTGAFSDLWAFLAGTAQMLKDRSPGQFTPQNWGILQAAGVCLAQDTGGGNLDGGAAGSPPGSNPYDWIFCVTSDTPVLCSDLRWKPAGTLVEGEKIIAFDENASPDITKRCRRRFREAYIVSNTPEVKECFEINTDIGEPVKATADHPWLVWSPLRRLSNGKQWEGLEWKKTAELKPGDFIAHFSKPWKEDESRRAGWLAGIFDGEGHVGTQHWSTRKGSGGSSIQLNIGQNKGVVLDRIKYELDDRGIAYYEHEVSVKGRARAPASQIHISGSRQVFRFLGTIRPIRLLENLRKKDYLPGVKRTITYDLAEVVSVKPIGPSRVASIQTSSGTFITGGYLSHNTYRNPLTGNEGNPSLSMLDNATVANGLPLALHNRQATITIWGALDPQMDNQNAIALYRRGGVFSDGLYRLVGYFQNPPPTFGAASPLVILDNKSDLDLVDAKTAEFDNDAPVTSRLQTPINATLTAFFSQAPGGGWHQFQIDQNFDGLGGAQLVKAGSVVQFLGDGNSENVVIFFVVSPNSAIAYFQYNHAPGEPVTMDSCANMACPYAYSAFDSIFLAGDPNNPHLLYKSKTGRPESFPLISSDGTANAIIVGSPDNPIMNITEFRDYMLCMNRFSFFVVPVISGQMLAPSETPAQRGLADPWAWTRGDNAIRYLGNDGFYAWDGGQSTKLSEAIDAFFHGRTEGGLPPFFYGVTAIPPTRVEYVHNEVWLCFTPLSAL